MQLNRQQKLSLGLRVVVLALLAMHLVGCHAQPAQWPELGRDRDRFDNRTTRDKRPAANEPLLKIEPFTSSEVAQLSADDIVRITKRIGFTDQQVIELGADLRNALYLSGGARVIYRGNVDALIQVRGPDIYIQTASRGQHVYDMTHGTFRFE